MNRPLYTILLRLFTPILLIWMSYRARRAGGEWQILAGPRFGKYHTPATQKNPIWIHAVSLGETRAAQPLIKALLEKGEQLILTHITATGRAEGSRVYEKYIESGQLVQQWLPYDFPGATKRFLMHYRPKIGVIMEREIWPNLIASAKRLDIPMVLASARFSDQSLRTTLRLGGLMRQAYNGFDAIYAQTLNDAQRLEQAGAPAPRVSGNFKFDVSPPQDQVKHGHEFAQHLGRKIITIASTREGEDELFIQGILRALQRIELQGKNPEDELLFCLIPRHPQRFDTAAELLAKYNLSYVRRTDIIKECGSSYTKAATMCHGKNILLGDTLGETTRFYAAGQVAIVGGSFAPLGGQNFIEACAVGTPVIVGPHTRNFDQAVLDALDEGAAIRAHDADEAIQQALKLFEEPQRLSQMSQAGIHWVQKHTGAVARLIAYIENTTS